MWKSKLAKFKALRSFPNELISRHEDLLTVKVVSFDFFDTLAYRRSVSHYQMWKNESSAYFLSRAKAEVLARLLNRLKRIPEVSESDIYDRMPHHWGLDFEIELELRNLLPNSVTIAVLKKAVSDGRTVCIISDTHYRETDIKRFLNHLGIPEVKIFTSGEFLLTKSTGLFSEVQKYFGVLSSDWIHIGDNHQSDVLSPRRLGIESIQYPPMKSQLIDSGLISPLGYKFLKNSKGPGNEVISRMFTNLLSAINCGNSKPSSMPLVLGSVVGDLVSTAIAEELHNMHVKRQYNLILYSSRDGWLPFLAHKKIYPNDPIQYFKTSRKILEDLNFEKYLSATIGDSERILLFDLGWRGSTAKKVSAYFPNKKWDYVYWQLLGKKKKNQFELNPGNFFNRLRIWRSRDFLESIFTDPTRGYDRIDDDLIPTEREDSLGSRFKDLIIEGANNAINDHSASSSLRMASLYLESVSRYPSVDLIKFAEDHSHQINEKVAGRLVITTWKDLFGDSKILWPYGSRLYSGNKISRSIFAATVFLKEFTQRSLNFMAKFRKTI